MCGFVVFWDKIGTQFAYEQTGEKFFRWKAMEIKDVNNMTTIQALFAKAVAGVSSGQTLGSGFASLVGQVGDVVSANNKNDVVTSDKVSGVEDKQGEKIERPDVKKDKPADKARPEKSEKQEASEKTQERKKQKSVRDDSVSMQENMNAAEVSKPIEVSEAVVAEAATPVAAEQVAEANAVVSQAAEAGAVAVVDGANVVLVPGAEVDLSALAQMPEVKVLDQASGEVVSIKGSELAAKIQQASEQGTLFGAMVQEGEQFADLILVEVNTDEEGRILVSAKNTGTQEEVVSLVDDVLVEQAEVLDAKLGENQKVKVEVDVKEEKISSFNEKAAVQDKVALDEVVSSVLDEKKSTDKSAQVLGNGAQLKVAQAQVGNGSQVQMNQGVNPMSAPIASAGTDVLNGAESAKISAVEGVGSAGTNNSTLGTAALAGNVRAEAKAQTSETSFRDVYKGMSKEVIDQVKVNITKSAVKGVDNIEIKLKPEDLGHIEVKMQISKDGKLHAHIISSRPETMDILQREAGSLEKAFNEAGFDMDSGSLSFSFREGSESGQDRNSELRNFIGSVMEHDAESGMAGNDNLEWTPAQGLNIKV